MKPSAVLLSVIFGVIVLVGIVWLGRYPHAQSAASASATDQDEGPSIAPTGPYPKAVVEQTEYNFGTMAWQGEGEHTFVIRNEGDANLVAVALEKDRTCNCTGADLSTLDPVPPGQTLNVTIRWKVKSRAAEFRHSAVVRTNDPKNKAIRFEITGNIVERIQSKPSGDWSLGELSTTLPTTITGKVFSEMYDAFQIEAVECANPKVTVTWQPMTDEQKLEEKARSGYMVTASVGPDVPIGPFNELVKLVTSIEEHKHLEFRLRGNRPGPVAFFGAGFHSEHNVLQLGEFPAADGKESTLTVVFRDFDEEVKLLRTEQKYGSVQLEFEPLPVKPGGYRRYLLKVRVPPGPVQDRQRLNSERVELYFNHPQAQQVKLAIDYLAASSEQ